MSKPSSVNNPQDVEFNFTIMWGCTGQSLMGPNGLNCDYCNNDLSLELPASNQHEMEEPF